MASRLVTLPRAGALARARALPGARRFTAAPPAAEAPPPPAAAEAPPSFWREWHRIIKGAAIVLTVGTPLFLGHVVQDDAEARALMREHAPEVLAALTRLGYDVAPDVPPAGQGVRRPVPGQSLKVRTAVYDRRSGGLLAAIEGDVAAEASMAGHAASAAAAAGVAAPADAVVDARAADVWDGVVYAARAVAANGGCLLPPPAAVAVPDACGVVAASPEALLGLARAAEAAAPPPPSPTGLASSGSRMSGLAASARAASSASAAATLRVEAAPEASSHPRTGGKRYREPAPPPAEVNVTSLLKELGHKGAGSNGSSNGSSSGWRSLLSSSSASSSSSSLLTAPSAGASAEEVAILAADEAVVSKVWTPGPGSVMSARRPAGAGEGWSALPLFAPSPVEAALSRQRCARIGLLVEAAAAAKSSPTAAASPSSTTASTPTPRPGGPFSSPFVDPLAALALPGTTKPVAEAATTTQ